MANGNIFRPFTGVPDVPTVRVPTGVIRDFPSGFQQRLREIPATTISGEVEEPIPPRFPRRFLPEGGGGFAAPAQGGIDTPVIEPRTQPTIDSPTRTITPTRTLTPSQQAFLNLLRRTKKPTIEEEFLFSRRRRRIGTRARFTGRKRATIVIPKRKNLFFNFGRKR